VVLFREDGFPAADGIDGAADSLAGLATATPIGAARASELPETLNSCTMGDLLILPYGGAFPRDAWPAVFAFLERGGSLLNLGGVPFQVPVGPGAGGGWVAGAKTTAYHRRLGITQSVVLEQDPLRGLAPADPGWRTAETVASGSAFTRAFPLTVRLSSIKDFPSEDGSTGPREAVVVPCVVAEEQGVRSASPVVVIDRLQGQYAGARWVFVTAAGSMVNNALEALLDLARARPLEFRLQPSLACYHEGEIPTLVLEAASPAGTRGLETDTAQVTVTAPNGKVLARRSVPLVAAGTTVAGEWVMSGIGTLKPGLYNIDAALPLSDTSRRTSAQMIRATSGFWVFDRALLASGPVLTADRFGLLADAQPFPVTGTTYMAGDSHRKFLLHPNPAVWDGDFGRMKEAGVSMVRTGIWTGWRRIMLDQGLPDRAVMRALDAFMLTARKHDIAVTFTFFAFLPEMWGGENPYCDPRSVRAQQDFVSALARRYAGMRDVLWDFINEPSFSSPRQLWLCRPNYDRHEQKAWREWLRRRFPSGDQEARDAFGMTMDEPLSLPPLEEFSETNIIGERRPARVAAYRLFAQEAFAGWVEQMKAALHPAGRPAQLVTVGQDEGGTYERPGPMFYGAAVDLTSVHSWWFNDDLLWDQVVTKHPLKANLVQETGVMLYERMDGTPWRSPEEVAALLERKLATAIGGGTAGYIQWLWNTNPYMPSDNEAAIGMLRADGSAKPEFGVFAGMNRFVRSVAGTLTGREPEEVMVLLPHAHIFSTRNAATDATRVSIRTLGVDLQIPVRASSDYTLDAVDPVPKLIVAPHPRMLGAGAWGRLLRLVEGGATLLVTGVLEADEFGRPAPRVAGLGVPVSRRGVAQSESLLLDGRSYAVQFRGDAMQRLECGGSGEGAVQVHEVKKGAGTLLWCPLPLESAEAGEALPALYRFALARADVRPELEFTNIRGIAPVWTLYKSVAVVALVSEAGGQRTVGVRHVPTGAAHEVTVPGGRAVMVVIERKSGSVKREMRNTE
jgi:hypothetical protein